MRRLYYLDRNNLSWKYPSLLIQGERLDYFPRISLSLQLHRDKNCVAKIRFSVQLERWQLTLKPCKAAAADKNARQINLAGGILDPSPHAAAQYAEAGLWQHLPGTDNLSVMSSCWHFKGESCPAASCQCSQATVLILYRNSFAYV